MVQLLKNWWSRDGEASPHDQDLELTVTRMLVSMMRMDDRMDVHEHDEIIRLLGKRFSLSEDDAEILIQRALYIRSDGPGFEQLVQQINDNYDRDEVALLLSDIWRVAEADGRIDFYEERYISRLSSLLKVPSRVVREAKQHSMAAA